MVQSLRNADYDAALAGVDGANQAVVLDAAAATMADVTANALADVALAAGDIVLAAGTPTGREAQVAAKLGVPVDTSGTPTHLALVNTGDAPTDPPRALTEVGGPDLTAGSTVDIPAWKVIYNQPT